MSITTGEMACSLTPNYLRPVHFRFCRTDFWVSIVQYGQQLIEFMPSGGVVEKGGELMNWTNVGQVENEVY